MLLVLLLLAAVTASAQPVGDGVALLRQVAEAARSAQGWRAEGTVGGTPLTISRRGPQEMRIFSGRDTATAFSLTVCNGVDIWNLWYNGISSAGDLWTPIAEECMLPAVQWDALLDSLQSAVLVGKDAALGCVYVRAEYAAPPRPIILNPQNYQLRPDARVLCVNEVSKVILWERFNADSFVMSLTKIERDPAFGPDEFKIPEVFYRRTDPGRRTDRLLQLLWALPLHFCVGASPNVGCVANPFALK